MKEIIKEKLEACNVCPRNCIVDRANGKIGYCKCNDKVKVALVSTHDFEEPCISKSNGSGTIFFSNCNLNCMFCQNYEISQLGKGREITIDRLAEIFVEQQRRGVNNINLVTPTMYAYQIIEAIKIARNKGLNIPVIYNSNGYESVQTIKDLNGYKDVYLPDFKYYSDEIAIKYSKAPHYKEIASEAIKEMYNQVGPAQFDENGIIKKGVIIRHLILPNHVQNSKNILKWIKEEKAKTKIVDKIGIGKSRESLAIELICSADQIQNEQERKLYEMLYEASEDGVLEKNELKKWCRKRYSRILKWFDDVIRTEKNRMFEEKLLLKTDEKTVLHTM